MVSHQTLTLILLVRFQVPLPGITHHRIVENTQRYERWNGGSIPSGGTNIYLSSVNGSTTVSKTARKGSNPLGDAIISSLSETVMSFCHLWGLFLINMHIKVFNGKTHIR